MGLSSMPAPSEGVLTLILVNTAISISIIRGILHSVMRAIGYRSQGVPDQDFDGEVQLAGSVCCGEQSLTNRFRTRFKPVRFSAAATAGRKIADCRVCLNRFEPESEVDRLACGHVFHKGCLERWLDYQHATCPLCRTHLLLADDLPAEAGVAAATVAWV